MNSNENEISNLFFNYSLNLAHFPKIILYFTIIVENSNRIKSKTRDKYPKGLINLTYILYQLLPTFSSHGTLLIKYK